MEQPECSETSAYKSQTLGNYPEESIQYEKFIIYIKNFSSVKTTHYVTNTLGNARYFLVNCVTA